MGKKMTMNVVEKWVNPEPVLVLLSVLGHDVRRPLVDWVWLGDQICAYVEEGSMLWQMYDDCDWLYVDYDGIKYAYRGYDDMGRGTYRLRFGRD